jgi:predicted transcriptional regulator
MNKTLAEVVLQNLAPMTYYRASDIADEANLNKQTVSSVLRELARGGVIERIKEKSRVVYITKQSRLF